MTLKRIVLTVAAALAVGSCGDDGPTPPGTLRFGQIGEVRLHLATPLPGRGELQQALTWNSQGIWQLTEIISYRGEIGDQNEVRNVPTASSLAGDYATWITLVNDLPTLTLFDPTILDPTVNPECGVARTRITLRIRDTPLGEDRQWVRCVDGSLSTLVTTNAEPGPGAARVANAALLLRDFIFQPPRQFESSYHGSLPFATLARGEDTPVTLNQPLVIADRQAWIDFWILHAGSITGLPVVDFPRETVLVAAIGQRFEAGETVEVRRVLPVDDGTRVELVHRVPGNFCSPIARTHRPFHMVVVPAESASLPIRFAQPVVEEVPCG